jgi:hypothetical protein
MHQRGVFMRAPLEGHVAKGSSQSAVQQTQQDLSRSAPVDEKNSSVATPSSQPPQREAAVRREREAAAKGRPADVASKLVTTSPSLRERPSHPDVSPSTPLSLPQASVLGNCVVSNDASPVVKAEPLRENSTPRPHYMDPKVPLDEPIVVDLRRQFKPNIVQPPPIEDIFGVPKTKLRSPALMGRQSPSSSPARKGPSEPERDSRRSSPHRATVAVHAPDEVPFELFSTFRTPQPGRPSAWAKAPQKVGLFDTSPRRFRDLVAAVHNHMHQSSSDESLDVDASGRLVRIIRDVPRGADKVRAQIELCKRLSAPRPLFVRVPEHDDRHSAPQTLE